MKGKPARPLRPRRPRRPPEPAGAADLAAAVVACGERKAVDGLVLDLRGLTDVTDAFLIASGTSDTHVRAIAEHVLETLRLRGARAHHVEGLSAGRWALLDYVDFVVHVFHPALREFYQLERLWGDAPRRPLAAGEES
jgi:ribosome-associated protein